MTSTYGLPADLNDVELNTSSESDNTEHRTVLYSMPVPSKSASILSQNTNTKNINKLIGEEEEKKDIEVIENEMETMESSDETWYSTMMNIGYKVLYAADFLGEVFAEFFGMTQSRYQWAVDAYERQQRWDLEDKKREEYHKRLALEEQQKLQELKMQQKNENMLANAEMKEEENDVQLVIIKDSMIETNMNGLSMIPELIERGNAEEQVLEEVEKKNEN